MPDNGHHLDAGRSDPARRREDTATGEYERKEKSCNGILEKFHGDKKACLWCCRQSIEWTSNIP
jgi:hypothetical protein